MVSITGYGKPFEEIKHLHPEVAIRGARDEDVPFIMKRSLADIRWADFVRNIPNSLYNHYMHKLLEWHIYSGKVLVACDRDNPDNILGFLIYEAGSIGLIVHYLYVRKDKDGPSYRGQGIATKLMTAAGADADTEITYTIRTPMFRFSPTWRHKIDNDKKIRHNLFLLFTLHLPRGWESRTPGTP